MCLARQSSPPPPNPVIIFTYHWAHSSLKPSAHGEFSLDISWDFVEGKRGKALIYSFLLFIFHVFPFHEFLFWQILDIFVPPFFPSFCPCRGIIGLGLACLLIVFFPSRLWKYCTVVFGQSQSLFKGVTCFAFLMFCMLMFSWSLKFINFILVGVYVGLSFFFSTPKWSWENSFNLRNQVLFQTKYILIIYYYYFISFLLSFWISYTCNI